MNTPPNALIRISRSASTHQNSPLNHEITGDRDRLLPAGGTDEYGACFCASASEMADAAGDYAWWFAGVLNKQLTKLQRHVHYTFFASENERKAFGEYRATLARFAQSPLSKSPTISVKCAIKSFEDCLSKLESAGYDGPLPLERHPLARFIANERAKEQLGAPQGTSADHEEKSELLKTRAREYLERIDDINGAKQCDLTSGDYLKRMDTLIFLWTYGAYYQAALQELDSWQRRLG